MGQDYDPVVEQSDIQIQQPPDAASISDPGRAKQQSVVLPASNSISATPMTPNKMRKV